MLKLVLPILLTVAAGDRKCDHATLQLPEYKNATKDSVATLTTSAGAPVGYRDATSTLNKNLLENTYVIDMLMDFIRERTPERVVHSQGNGAFGYFESTLDISDICKAKLFEVGKRTPIAVRFSRGLSDGHSWRALRGFAVKFYTQEGNWDIVGFNTPVFPFNDPVYFAHISHAVRPNPATNLYDPNMFWDFLSSDRQLLLICMYLFSNIATPRGYHHMPGHSIHTYEVYNEKSEKSFVRIHFLPQAGVDNFNTTEAKNADLDFYTRDLYNRIRKGEYPRWDVTMQILTQEDVDNADIDIHDATRDLPDDIYPHKKIGVFELNKNCDNYYSEIEKLAFCPTNLILGIMGSSTKLFEARRLAYKNAQLYRLGSNFNKIQVNCPLQAFTYIRNGAPPFGDNGKNTPNYYPNSFHGYEPYDDETVPSLSKLHEKTPDNFDQASKFYSTLSPQEQCELVANIAESMCSCEDNIKDRVIKTFTEVHSGFGNSLAKALVDSGCADAC